MTRIPDEDLGHLLHDAHRDDAPPPYAALRARARRPRKTWALLAAAPAAALIVALAIWPRRPAPVPPLAVSYEAPLDFLLDVPGANLLRDTPRFDLKGTLP